MTDPYVEYQVDATPEDTFVVPFVFWYETELEVRFEDVVQVGWTATGQGEPTGGQIVLASPVSNGKLSIQRIIPFERYAIFPVYGPFRIEALNNELSRIIAMVQDRAFIGANGDITWDRIIGKPETFPPPDGYYDGYYAQLGASNTFAAQVSIQYGATGSQIRVLNTLVDEAEPHGGGHIRITDDGRYLLGLMGTDGAFAENSCRVMPTSTNWFDDNIDPLAIMTASGADERYSRLPSNKRWITRNSAGVRVIGTAYVNSGTDVCHMAVSLKHNNEMDLEFKASGTSDWIDVFYIEAPGETEHTFWTVDLYPGDQMRIKELSGSGSIVIMNWSERGGLIEEA